MSTFLFYASIGIVIAFMSFNLWSLLREQRIITDTSWKVFACDECFSYWSSIILISILYLVTGWIEVITSLASAFIAIKFLSKDYWS